MNREHWKERLPWIQAWCNGETLQYRSRLGGEWRDDEEPNFEDDEWEFRIAPKPRKVWVNEYENGQLGNTHNDKREADAENLRCNSIRVACHELELPPVE